LKETNISEDEVINIKWVKKEEMKKMYEDDKMVEPLDYIFQLMKENIV